LDGRGRFPDNLIDTILARVDIVDVISEFLTLKRAGSNYKCLCPFHKERTPSFMVSPTKQIFKCFGCGEGGNVITFLRKHEKMSFAEAIEYLAKRAGVKLPELKRESGRYEALYKVNKWAEEFFRRCIEAKEGEKARSYLARRGFEKEDIERFHLGYAPRGWENLLSQARRAGFSREVLLQAGLVVEGEGGRIYDRFRERVIFPIFNLRGAVVGFGGRVLGDGEPKYLNSPETPIYRKGELLYGLNWAKGAVRQKEFLILVEGYMDALSLIKAGIENVAATLGTALTHEHARTILRFCRDVVLIYDGDEAGLRASLRGLEVLVEEGVHVKVVALPQGYDPDTFVRERGAEQMEHLVKSAENIINFTFNLLTFEHDISKIDGQIRVVEELASLIAKVPEEFERDIYIKDVAEKLGIQQEGLRRKVGKFLKKGVRGKEEREEEQELPASFATEKLLIGLLIDEPGELVWVRERLNAEDFQVPECRRIYEALIETDDGNYNVAMSKVEDEGARRLFSELCMGERDFEDKTSLLRDCVEKMEFYRKKRERVDILAQIKVAEKEGRDITPLLQKLKEKL